MDGADGRLVGNDDRELLAAVSRRQVVVPALIGDGAGRFLEQLVADVVAVEVVYVFEMVKVGHDERHLASVPLDPCPFALQPLHQSTAVRQSSERVDMGVLDQQILQVFRAQGRADPGA